MSIFGLFFFFKQKTAYEIMPSLVGSEMCIRDRPRLVVGAALPEPGRSQDRLRGVVVTVRRRVEPNEAQSIIGDRAEGKGSHSLDRLADDSAPPGARPQPVAELALE